MSVWIGNERAFAIFSVTLKWTEDHEGGERPNGTQSYRMYRDHPGDEMVLADARLWWAYQLGKPASSFKEGSPILRDLHPRDVRIDVKFVRHEVWCIGWFDHWTFDLGLSDAKVLASFQHFVFRMEDLNHRETRYVKNDKTGYTHPIAPYCLMGAEDNWRWHGVKDDIAGNGTSDEHTPPPCRCKHCRAASVVRINH